MVPSRAGAGRPHLVTGTLHVVRLTATSLEHVFLVEPTVHGDDRGFFVETFRHEILAAAGLTAEFVQDNHSRSKYGVVRGMHFQPGQAKLVRCARGTVFDVVVDVRVSSPTFGQWEGFRLDDETHQQLFVPDGMAHGFCVLSDEADLVYKVSTYYDPSTESGFSLEDAAVGIKWPIPSDRRLVSVRDSSAPTLAELTSTPTSR